ncbi:MAG: hypothetical protein EA397_05225 [Deltaproteobacteria bacterium]|nr:MAG: hypothetical protein EA397_05225 [Deltaproteobacteria bacterium]
MHWFVSADPAQLGTRIDASSAEEAVQAAVEAGEIGPGVAVIVRWDVKFKEGSRTEWWFAHTTSLQSPGEPAAPSGKDKKASTSKDAGKTDDEAPKADDKKASTAKDAGKTDDKAPKADDKKASTAKDAGKTDDKAPKADDKKASTAKDAGKTDDKAPKADDKKASTAKDAGKTKSKK